MRKDSRSEGKLMGVNEIGSRRVKAESILQCFPKTLSDAVFFFFLANAHRELDTD